MQINLELPRTPIFAMGARVTKIKGSRWTGRVVGYYSTKLTQMGYCVESETEFGSVQIYPENALMRAPGVSKREELIGR